MRAAAYAAAFFVSAHFPQGTGVERKTGTFRFPFHLNDPLCVTHCMCGFSSHEQFSLRNFTFFFSYESSVFFSYLFLELSVFFSYQCSSVFSPCGVLQFSAVEFSSSLQFFVFSFEFPSIFNYVFSILLRLSSAQQPALEQNEEIRSEN